MGNADFERCADFLARMIEKYGGELDLPKTEKRNQSEESSLQEQEKEFLTVA